MDRGFNFYFREGIKASTQTLFKKEKSNYWKSMLDFCMKLVGCLLVVFIPLVAFSNARQGDAVRRERKLDISQSYKSLGNPKAVLTLYLAMAVELLMLLGGLVGIGVVAFLIGAIGYGIGLIVGSNAMVLFYVFLVPGAGAMVAYTVILSIILAPTAYVVATNNGIGVADTLSVCFSTMKSRGKLTLFLNHLFADGLKVVYLGVFAGIGALLAKLTFGTPASIVLLAILALVCIGGLAFGGPILTLCKRSSNRHLFEDIVVDPVAVSRASRGINIMQYNGKKFAPSDLDRNIVAMFDETEADAYTTSEILEEEARRQKKNKREAVVPEKVFNEIAPAEVASGEQPVYTPPAGMAPPPYAQAPQPAPGFPAPGFPAPEAPAFETPAPEAPVFEEGAPAEPAFDAPAPDAPAFEEPAFEAPAFDEPAPEAPAFEEPVSEAPAFEEPAPEAAPEAPAAAEGDMDLSVFDEAAEEELTPKRRRKKA